LIGLSFSQSDIALTKAISIFEGGALRFRADAVNAFNKVNLGNPDACVDCAGGGAITSLAKELLRENYGSHSVSSFKICS
jgi:hypothetical protein